jgi:hypothetical protein
LTEPADQTPPQVAPQHIITALQQELARVNDNRIYLIALVEQLTRRIAELEVNESPPQTV